jgi:signal transduction histidine kinase
MNNRRLTPRSISISAIAPDDVSTVLQWLTTAPAGGVEPEFLQRLTDRLAAVIDADRILIARVYDSVLPPPAIWVAASTQRRASSEDVPAAGEALIARFPDAFARLNRGECCLSDGTAHSALVPIPVEGVLWGLIGIADAARPIDADDLAALEPIAGALAKRAIKGRLDSTGPESYASRAFLNIGEPLVVYDADLRVAWYNPAWRESISYARPGEDLRGLSLVEISRINVEKGYWTPQRADEVFRDFASRRFAISRERTTSIGGTYLRHRNYPLSNGGFVGIRTDVTDMVLRQYELSEAKDRAEATSRAKSAFLATVSHELRTPLNAIIGFSELMRNGVFGPLANKRYADYTADIHHSGQMLLSLIDDLLDMARIEAGKVELRPEPVSVHDLLGEIMRVVDMRANSQKITLTRDARPDLPPILVDRRATVQILLNVVGNAIKFTPGGGRVSIDVRPEGAAMLCVAIADSGPGIDPKYLSRLGRPFERADGDQFGIAQKNRGTGLGLAISRSLAENQGGSLRIRSELGVGTTVELLVPTIGTAAEPARRASAVSPPG